MQAMPDTTVLRMASEIRITVTLTFFQQGKQGNNTFDALLKLLQKYSRRNRKCHLKSFYPLVIIFMLKRNILL